jgi:hypothetical protein
MSVLVALTATVPATSNSSLITVDLTAGTLFAAVAFRNIALAAANWAPGFDSGWSFRAATSGGAALLGINSSGGAVTASITASALDVPVTFELTGRNGVVIGTAELPAGQTSSSFSFPVDQGVGLSPLELGAMIGPFWRQNS